MLLCSMADYDVTASDNDETGYCDEEETFLTFDDIDELLKSPSI